MKTLPIFALILSLTAATFTAAAGGKAATTAPVSPPPKSPTPPPASSPANPPPSASAPAPSSAPPTTPPPSANGCPAYAGTISAQGNSANAQLFGAGVNPMPAIPPGKQTIPSLPADLTAAGVTAWPTMDKPPPTAQPWFRKYDISSCPTDPPRATVSTCGPTLSASQDANNPTCAFSCGGCTTPTTPGIPADWTTCKNPGQWGLTFDDGPASLETGTLLNTAVAPANGIKAQMFIVGSRVLEFPDTLKLEFQSGHVISVHTWSHTALTTQTSDEVVAEVLWTEKVIQTVLNVVPKYFRPPYGDVDNRVRCILNKLGYTNIIWKVDTGDFAAGQPGFDAVHWIPGNFTAWMTQYPATGQTWPISLNHDIHIQGVKAMPEAICTLRKAGYNPVPPPSCNGDDSPYQTSAALAAGTGGNVTGSPSSAVSAKNNAPFALLITLAACLFFL